MKKVWGSEAQAPRYFRQVLVESAESSRVEIKMHSRGGFMGFGYVRWAFWTS